MVSKLGEIDREHFSLFFFIPDDVVHTFLLPGLEFCPRFRKSGVLSSCEVEEPAGPPSIAHRNESVLLFLCGDPFCGSNEGPVFLSFERETSPPPKEDENQDRPGKEGRFSCPRENLDDSSYTEREEECQSREKVTSTCSGKLWRQQDQCEPVHDRKADVKEGVPFPTGEEKSQESEGEENIVGDSSHFLCEDP